MKKSSIISLVALLCVGTAMIIVWGYNEQKFSYSQPNEAVLAVDKDLVLIPAYKNNDESLFFFIKDKNHLGATVAHKGIFGWKSGMFTWSPFTRNGESGIMAGKQGHGDHLIYGLISDIDEKMITVDDQPAVILNLEMLPQSVVKENKLEGLYLWYFEGENVLNYQQIELIHQETQEVIQVWDL
jgi:hypothetical protein